MPFDSNTLNKNYNGLDSNSVYRDEEESDTFMLSGAEDLIPLMDLEGGILKNFIQKNGNSAFGIG